MFLKTIKEKTLLKYQLWKYFELKQDNTEYLIILGNETNELLYWGIDNLDNGDKYIIYKNSYYKDIIFKKNISLIFYDFIKNYYEEQKSEMIKNKIKLITKRNIFNKYITNLCNVIEKESILFYAEKNKITIENKEKIPEIPEYVFNRIKEYNKQFYAEEIHKKLQGIIDIINGQDLNADEDFQRIKIGILKLLENNDKNEKILEEKK